MLGAILTKGLLTMDQNRKAAMLSGVSRDIMLVYPSMAALMLQARLT